MRATKPNKAEKRIKMLLYGEAGVGKTYCSIQFPKAYIIDTEHGTDQYSKVIIENDSVVFQTNSFFEVKEELKSLLKDTEYKTLIIDPITPLYVDLQEHWSKKFEKYATDQKQIDMMDYGIRYWQKIKADYRTLHNLLLKLDKNIIITAHEKPEYGPGLQKIGSTYDSMRGDDYIYDYVFQLKKHSDGRRLAYKIKERSLPNEQKFPDQFEWNFQNFVKMYGNIINKEPEPVTLATKEQIEELEKLIEIINVDQDIIDKWLAKAEAETFADMTYEQISRCISYLKEKIKI